MTTKQIKKEIEFLVERLDSLGKGYKFFTADNKENFAEIKESLVIGLDELEELVEGDEALKDAMSVTESE